jgi:DNA topoisomerase I
MVPQGWIVAVERYEMRSLVNFLHHTRHGSIIFLGMEKHIVIRKKSGRSFQYIQDSKVINDTSRLDYFASLKIPPAWRDVTIAASKNAKIQATGIDKAGRLQYMYHPSFRSKKEREKFSRTLRFAQALPKLRRITSRHLRHRKLDREKVLACIVRLMDQAYFRVGNDVYAKENQSYGLTTLRSKHVQVKGDTITFDFVGKSNQKHVKQVSDELLARVVKKLDELPGYEIFKYYDEAGELHDVKSGDVNNYIKSIMGEEFTAKDFRTWGGTLLASMELATVNAELSDQDRKKAIAACVKKVAKRLGNTPAIARSSYIDPRLFKVFMSQKGLGIMKNTIQGMKQKAYVSTQEQCVLKILGAA